LQDEHRIYGILALCAVAGAGVGVFFASVAGATYWHMMHVATGCPVSIVGSVLTVFIPYFVSVQFILKHRRWLGLAAFTLLVFRFSGTAWCITQSFGSAAWLIRGLYLFPDICLLPLICVLFTAPRWRIPNFRILLYCSVHIVVITLVYFCIVSPFVVSIINF